MDLEHLTDNIYYIRHTESPFSADSFVIKDRNKDYIFDVGANPYFVPILNRLSVQKDIILSHFHEDHIKNLSLVLYDTLYLSKETYKYVHSGTIIEEDKVLSDSIKIGPIPSSHTKNSLYLLYKNYLFVGDALDPGKGQYNVQKTKELIDKLTSLDFKYVLISHEEKIIHSKEEILFDLKNIYEKREKNSPFIPVRGIH